MANTDVLCSRLRVLCRNRCSLTVIIIVVVVLEPFGSTLTYGFPPYRSTDAETADPWTLEGRLGLFRIERERRENAYTSPLLRFNLGLPGNREFVSEFEYRPDEGKVADAAVGFKWIPLMRSLSVGIETLVLLPVSSPQNKGAGVESLLLTTLRVGAVRVHVNAGGFYDARPAESESGWKSGGIVEVRRGRFRPGVEVFAKQVGGQPIEVQGGPGLILDLGPFDLRIGLHVGLTAEAVNLTPNFWITSKFPLQ